MPLLSNVFWYYCFFMYSHAYSDKLKNNIQAQTNTSHTLNNFPIWNVFSVSGSKITVHLLWVLGIWRFRVSDLEQGSGVWCWKGARPRLNIILKWSAGSQNITPNRPKCWSLLYSSVSYNLYCSRSGSVLLYSHYKWEIFTNFRTYWWKQELL